MPGGHPRGADEPAGQYVPCGHSYPVVPSTGRGDSALWSIRGISVQAGRKSRKYGVRKDSNEELDIYIAGLLMLHLW